MGRLLPLQCALYLFHEGVDVDGDALQSCLAGDQTGGAATTTAIEIGIRKINTKSPDGLTVRALEYLRVSGGRLLKDHFLG